MRGGSVGPLGQIARDHDEIQRLGEASHVAGHGLGHGQRGRPVRGSGVARHLQMQVRDMGKPHGVSPPGRRSLMAPPLT